MCQTPEPSGVDRLHSLWNFCELCVTQAAMLNALGKGGRKIGWLRAVLSKRPLTRKSYEWNRLWKEVIGAPCDDLYHQRGKSLVLMQLPKSWHQGCDSPIVPTARRTTILVVEDDAELRALYRTALTMAGYTVVAVDDGWSALRWIDVDRPDGIVLDLGLPRLSGRDFRAEISAHAETRDIPIVIVTGMVSNEDARALGVQCVLLKPVEPDAVVAAALRCFPPPPGGFPRKRNRRQSTV